MNRRALTLAELCLALAILAAAGLVGGMAAKTYRATGQAKPQKAEQPQAPPQQPPANCSSCSYPPPTALCMPAGLSQPCQWCYAADLNKAIVAGKIPSYRSTATNTVQYNWQLGWGYYAPWPGGWQPLPTCP